MQTIHTSHRPAVAAPAAAPAGPAGTPHRRTPPRAGLARAGDIVLYRSGGWEMAALVTVTAQASSPEWACVTPGPEGSQVSLIVFEPSGRQRPEHGVPWWRSPGARGRSWRHCNGPGAAEAARGTWPGVGSPEGL